MANLIIKSSADDLVLKGSGQTGSNAAITVAAAGTTTFAQNATLSGTANNLGTSTAGTLTSGVVFPAGHVISSDYGFYNGADISKNDTNFTEANSAMRVTITPTSPNKILLVCQGGIPHSGVSGYYMRCSWGIVGGSMNLADSSQGLETYTDNDKNGGHSYSILVTPGSYGSAITYTPTYSTASGVSYFTEGSANQNITTYALEIQQ